MTLFNGDDDIITLMLLRHIKAMFFFHYLFFLHCLLLYLIEIHNYTNAIIRMFKGPLGIYFVRCDPFIGHSYNIQFYKVYLKKKTIRICILYISYVYNVVYNTIVVLFPVAFFVCFFKTPPVGLVFCMYPRIHFYSTVSFLFI